MMKIVCKKPPFWIRLCLWFCKSEKWLEVTPEVTVELQIKRFRGITYVTQMGTTKTDSTLRGLQYDLIYVDEVKYD